MRMSIEAGPQTIGVVREPLVGETRVAATPTSARALIKLGYHIRVERGAGESSTFSNEDYETVGCELVENAWDSDIVLLIGSLQGSDIQRLKKGAFLIGMLSPGFEPELVKELSDAGITAISMDAVPRISRAQSMDVLSSTANVAGYRAVIEAAHDFGRFFTGQVTAAGKVPPAKVLVAGAGVAGLAAIGAAGSLGAIVRATDPRPEVAEQVKSLGGEYLPVVVSDDTNDDEPNDGYARATSELYDQAAAALYSSQARDVDIIITTALIPGRDAPRLITRSDVESMKSGSVIVDMAAARGGNVEGSEAGQRVVTPNGVTIIGYTDLAARMPAQSSQLYATNLVNLFKLLTQEESGRITLNLDDVVQRSITVTHNEEILWPPPPVSVSAAPKPDAQMNVSEDPLANGTAKKDGKLNRIILAALAFGLLFFVNATAPDPIPQHFTVLMLAIVIGYYVIGNVAHALHTPLMSVTNAISGIVVIGALLQVGSSDKIVQALAATAILFASINVFGGFSVTRRMLDMFTKG